MGPSVHQPRSMHHGRHHAFERPEAARIAQVALRAHQVEPAAATERSPA